MTAAVAADSERRIIVLPPTAADGQVAARVLTAAGMAAILCRTVGQLRREAEAGAAVLILAAEVLDDPRFAELAELLDRQPAWSDLPMIILTGRGQQRTAQWRAVAEQSLVRNAMLLERPMRPEMLVQALRVALRARERQYVLRAQIRERETLLAQREVLLREVYHRVKNNLQMMQSLVRLSAARAPVRAEPLFADLASRIGAIGLLHSRIYATGDLSRIDAADYLGDVVGQAEASFGALHGQVRIVRRLEPIVIDVDTAIPLGLITTELLTNAYRHAFPAGGGGVISVRLAVRDGIVELAVADDGVGARDKRRTPASTGLQLVQALARQVGGTFASRDAAGMLASVRFPLRPGATVAA
ncbi:MAG: sensor histidine kinase [Geminicoccaceae bacterium]